MCTRGLEARERCWGARDASGCKRGLGMRERTEVGWRVAFLVGRNRRDYIVRDKNATDTIDEDG